MEDQEGTETMAEVVTPEDVASESIAEEIWEPDFGNDGTFQLSDGDEEDSLLGWMNQRYFIVQTGSKVRVGIEEFDVIEGKPDFNLMKKADFVDMLANRFVLTGNKKIPLGVYWFRHPNRRQYKGLKFAPGETFDGYYNLWYDFACKPIEGDCSLYLEHVKQIVAGGDERITDYILDWMAHAVQRPGDLVGTAIVIRGKQGTGKGVFCNIFGELFGAHYTHVSQPSHLTGKFNRHLLRCVALFCDEAQWGSDKQGEGVLKALVTEPTLQIEGKGQDVIEIKNHIHLMVATNNELAVPAGPEERRFLVLDISDEHKQDHAYFRSIQDQMDNGGREALLHYLLHREYEPDNLRKIPQTQALFETKLLSVSPVHKFWYERLMSGSLRASQDKWSAGEILASELQDEYKAFTKESGLSSRSTSTELGIVLRKLLPGELRKVRKVVSGVRRIYYQLPLLAECRESFCAAMQTEIEWPDEGYAMKS